MSGAAALRLELRASLTLRFLALAVHAAAAAAVLAFLPLAQGAIAACLIGLLAAAVTWDRGIPGGVRSPLALTLGGDGELGVEFRGGAQNRGRLTAGRFVSRWLVVLEIEMPQAGRHRVVVARDMLSPGDFRRLCLWTLWGRLPAGPAAEGRPVAAIRTISSGSCL